MNEKRIVFLNSSFPRRLLFFVVQKFYSFYYSEFLSRRKSCKQEIRLIRKKTCNFFGLLFNLLIIINCNYYQLIIINWKLL